MAEESPALRMFRLVSQGEDADRRKAKGLVDWGLHVRRLLAVDLIDDLCVGVGDLSRPDTHRGTIYLVKLVNGRRAVTRHIDHREPFRGNLCDERARNFAQRRK